MNVFTCSGVACSSTYLRFDGVYGPPWSRNLAAYRSISLNAFSPRRVFVSWRCSLEKASSSMLLIVSECRCVRWNSRSRPALAASIKWKASCFSLGESLSQTWPRGPALCTRIDLGNGNGVTGSSWLNARESTRKKPSRMKTEKRIGWFLIRGPTDDQGTSYEAKGACQLVTPLQLYLPFYCFEPIDGASDRTSAASPQTHRPVPWLPIGALCDG